MNKRDLLSFAFIAVLSCACAASEPYQQAITNLDSSDPQVRKQACDTLGQMRNSASQDALIKLLNDPVAQVRSAAVDSLGLLRSLPAAKGISDLLDTDPEPSVRQACAIALGYIGDRNVLPALLKGIQDKHDGTRFACVNTLGILKDETAVPILADGLKNPDSRMRKSCAYSLGNIGGKRAVPQLMEALKVSRSTMSAKGQESWVDSSVGETILRSLGLIGDPSAVSSVKICVKDRDKRVRTLAAWALYRMGDKGGLEAAREASLDPDTYLRRCSAEVLGEFGDSRDLDLLKKMSNDPDLFVQQTAQRSLERLMARMPKAPSGKGSDKEKGKVK